MLRSFAGEFLEELSNFGSKTALIYRDVSISFCQFGKLIRNWAAILQRLDRRSSDPVRIALFSTNSPDIIAIIVASQLVGLTIVPLNPSYKKYEIREYLRQSAANFVLVSDDVDLEMFEEVEVHTISELLVEPRGELDELIETSGAIVFFSSGTTGPPKLFEYTQNILCAQLDQIREIRKDSRYFSPSDTDICYGVLPFFHAGGLVTVLSMLFSGCCVLVNERWNGSEFLANCQNSRVSVLFLVPPVLDFLANHPLVPSFDLTSLKTIYVGAAASPPGNFEKVSKRLPSLENLIQLYGTTECGVLLCSTRKGIATGNTVGLPYPMVEVKLDQENTEILVKSPTAIEDGFMHSGDLGCFCNKTNELEIVGRSKEMMKVRGWQVNPNEIEDVIRKVNAVVDCAVYQKPGSDLLVAKVIGNPDSKEEILMAVKENLASYKQLDDLIFVTELPRNPSGKLMRHLLIF